MIKVSGVKVSVLIDSGIHDNSFPTTMDAYAHSESALLPRAKGFLRTKASYFDTVRTCDLLNL